MRDRVKRLHRRSRILQWASGIVFLLGCAVLLLSCSSGGSQTAAGLGTINVSMTDPPSCMFPNSSLQHVYVTAKSVQANISATADDGSGG